MTVSDVEGSPLEAVGDATSSRAVAAFKLLGNETRLAILLALWETVDPVGTAEPQTFSELYDRVDAQDTGNFNYHLEKLTDHFVAEQPEGYTLRNAGEQIVQAVIAGTGIDDPHLPPTETPRRCHRCEAPIVVKYDDEHLYQRCTGCAGNFGPDALDPAEEGTVMLHDFKPAGVTDRSAEEVFVAGSVEFLRDTGLLIRGVCPRCSGTVEGTLNVCDDHDLVDGQVCPTCGTRDEVRAQYRCTVCKYGSSFPAEGAVHDHPAVVTFRYEHGIEGTYDLDSPTTCAKLWDHLMNYQHRITDRDPLRVVVTVPGPNQDLEVTLDETLTVIDITRG